MTVFVHTAHEIIFKAIAEFFEAQGVTCHPYSDDFLDGSCLLWDASSKTDIPKVSFPVLVFEKKKNPLSLDELFQLYQEKCKPKNTDVFFVGSYEISPKNRQAVYQDNVIVLTEKEVMILGALHYAKTPLTKEQILKHVWGYEPGIDTHTLETHIYKLRKKLSPQNPEALIRTLKEGYVLA